MTTKACRSGPSPGSRDGQALIEMLVSAGLVGALLYGGARLLMTGFERLRCSRMAFEAAHDRLLGTPAGLSTSVLIRSELNRIVATARCGDQKESVGLTRLEARQRGGFATLPLAFLLAALASAALGLLGLQETWRRQVQVQLRLDHCAGEAALELATIQRAISSQNRRIHAARAAKAAALAAGQAQIAAAATATLELLGRSQDLQRLRWVVLQSRFAGWKSCTPNPMGRLSRPGPLPWHRPPPDPIGLRPLEWPREIPRRIAIHFRHQNRSSHASVSESKSRWVASYRLGTL
jgi:hypothetical protein